ncbi:MAG: nucleoside phosphorylase [Pyrinomonadaceae bacterium]|nr:nucleoside phosphorylase [Pyrinomonadaceae bacterium]
MNLPSFESQASEIVALDGRVYHLGLTPDELAPNVFLVGDPARAAKVASYFDHVLYEVTNREFKTYTGIYRELPVSVIGTGIGADNVEIAFVEAFVLNEFDLETKYRKPGAVPMTMIRLGTSGGVQPDVAPGTLVVSDYAIGLDSTGPYYEVPAGDEKMVTIEKEARRLVNEGISVESRFRSFAAPYVSKASNEVIDALELSAATHEFEYKRGITVTSPGFYGPSSRFIDGFSNTVSDIKLRLAELAVDGSRVLNMEMESSLLFHLAGAVGYYAGTICPIISGPTEADSLIDYNEAIDKTIKTGLAAMALLKS